MSAFTNETSPKEGDSGGSATSADVKEEDRKDPLLEWIRLEEVSMKESPPGLWTDDVEPQFEGKSFIFTETFKKMHLSWTGSKPDGDPQMTYMGSSRVNNNRGVLVVHGAVENGDLPFLRALGYFGTNFDFKDDENENFSPLLLAISIMNKYPSLASIPTAPSGGKVGMPVVEWLLSRGVDCNLLDKNKLSPLRHAVQNSYHVNKKTTADQKTWIDLAKLLLLHGADPKDLKHCSCDKMQAVLLAYVKELNSSKTSRPGTLCPCGKNVHFSLCHGRSDGVSLHPKRYCFCRSRKLYENCCLPRKFYYRESYKQQFSPIIRDKLAAQEKAIKKKIDSIQKEALAKGVSEVDFRKMNFVRGGIKEPVENLVAMVDSNPELFDPCFRWCLTHKNNNFLYGRPWRLESDPVTKEEAARRQTVWNAMVDEYIQDSSIIDIRSGSSIETLNKISLAGSTLWKRCAYCPGEESVPNTYLFCSRCKIVCYCSEECQRNDWKRVHKQLCGEDTQEEVIPSCRAMALVYNSSKVTSSE